MKKPYAPFVILALILVASALLFFRKANAPTKLDVKPEETKMVETNEQKPADTLPLARANERVTKKPFGIYITKANSPVQPERFAGYHTGTDFETFPEESDLDVPFYAICDGKILQKRTATGYGGVLIQSCTINSQAVAVVYGHVKLSSISKNIGDSLTQGEKIGFLGQPPKDTDGERKHLHLGIHKGSGIDIRGYVQSQPELSGWLDFQKL